MNKSMIIKEKQRKNSRRTTFCLQQQETKKISDSTLCFRLGFDVQSTRPKLTQSSPNRQNSSQGTKFSAPSTLMVVRNQRKDKEIVEIMCRKSRKKSSKLYLICFSSLLFKNNSSEGLRLLKKQERNQMEKMSRVAFSLKIEGKE